MISSRLQNFYSQSECIWSRKIEGHASVVAYRRWRFHIAPRCFAPLADRGTELDGGSQATTQKTNA